MLVLSCIIKLHVVEFVESSNSLAAEHISVLGSRQYAGLKIVTHFRLSKWGSTYKQVHLYTKYTVVINRHLTTELKYVNCNQHQ